MAFLRLQDLNLYDKKVLIRVDYNIPVDNNGFITDDSRIVASLPTLRYVISQKAKVILISHLGRPGGKTDPRLSLARCAEHLSRLTSKKIRFCSDCIGEKVKLAIDELKEGDVLLLENLRFHDEEEHPTPEDGFAKQLSSLADVFINDAFAASHRCHSSITSLPKYFPSMAAPGLLMEKEINILSKIFETPSTPFFAIIGGAKISTKLKVLTSLTQKASSFFLGGAMASTFLAAQGVSVADSTIEKDLFSEALSFLQYCQKKSIQVFLPIDAIALNSQSQEIFIISLSQNIPSGLQILDIGPATTTLWQKHLRTAKTIFWNGPVGKFEDSRFMQGTLSLAKVLASLPNCTTIIGGGDTACAIQSVGLENNFTHISTGGGAALEFIENQTLPGIEALKTS